MNSKKSKYQKPSLLAVRVFSLHLLETPTSTGHEGDNSSRRQRSDWSEE